MRRIQVIIREVDDQTPEPHTDLATFDLPATNVAALQPATARDQLEANAHTIGTQILQRLVLLALPHFPCRWCRSGCTG